MTSLCLQEQNKSVREMTRKWQTQPRSERIAFLLSSSPKVQVTPQVIGKIQAVSWDSCSLIPKPQSWVMRQRVPQQATRTLGLAFCFLSQQRVAVSAGVKGSPLIALETAAEHLERTQNFSVFLKTTQ